MSREGDEITSACPSVEALARLAEIGAEAELGADDAAILAHVSNCPRCCGEIEAMRADNVLLSHLAAAPDGGSRALDSAIPGYAILDELHRGAQGIVHRAIQQTTRRTVALKVLRSGVLATRSQRLRFEREIDVLASLRHPGIVTVYDGGVTNEGRHWLAMEFVAGLPLDEYVDAHAARLGRDGCLRLFAAVCAAVGAAHRSGVIHRDLKPDNVLVDKDGCPRVLDFGLARPINPELSERESALTAPSGFLGTLAYASPEQASGDPNRVDTRSDVYALGVILFQLLTGALPFATHGRFSEVLERIVALPPPAPSSMPAPHFAVDSDLDTIVLKALAKEPERRYESADALRADVERLLAGLPIDARRDSRWYLLRTLVRRHRAAVTLSALAVVVLLGFAFAMTVLYRSASMQAKKVARINVFLEDTLGSVSSAPTSETTVRELLDEGGLWVDLALDDDPEIEASVRTILGNGYRNLGLLDAAELHLAEALRLRENHMGATAPETASGLSALALLRRDQGRFDEATQLLERGLEIRIDRLGETAPEVETARVNLALVVAEVGDFARAETLMTMVLNARAARLGDAHPDVAMTRFSFGNMLASAGRPSDALALHTAALASRLDALDPRHPDLARSCITVALHVQALDLQKIRADDADITLLRRAEAALSNSQASDSALGREAIELVRSCIASAPILGDVWKKGSRP